MSKGIYCCVPGCYRNTRVHKGVSFSLFPKNEGLKSQWIKLINRPGKTENSVWKPTPHHKVCGYHFNPSGKRQSGDKLPLYYFPEMTIRRKCRAIAPAGGLTVDQLDPSSYSVVMNPAQEASTALGFVDVNAENFLPSELAHESGQDVDPLMEASSSLNPPEPLCFQEVSVLGNVKQEPPEMQHIPMSPVATMDTDEGRPTAYHNIQSGKKTYEGRLPIYLEQSGYKQPEVTIGGKYKLCFDSKKRQIIAIRQPSELRPTPLGPLIKSEVMDVGAEMVVDSRLPSRLLFQQTSRSQPTVKSPAALFEGGDHEYAIALSPDEAIQRLNEKLTGVINENKKLEEKVSNHERDHARTAARLTEANAKIRKLGLSLISSNLEKTMFEAKASKATYKVDCFVRSVIKDKNKVQFYTSFESVKKYKLFSESVEPGYNEARLKQREGLNKNVGRPQLLSFQGQLLMVLMRLKLGLLEQDLAYRFHISITTVSNICAFWFDFLRDHLESVPVLPSRQIMDKIHSRVVPSTDTNNPCKEMSTEEPSDINIQSD